MFCSRHFDALSHLSSVAGVCAVLQARNQAWRVTLRLTLRAAWAGAGTEVGGVDDGAVLDISSGLLQQPWSSVDPAGPATQSRSTSLIWFSSAPNCAEARRRRRVARCPAVSQAVGGSGIRIVKD